jgi:phytoene dehydrogenase-like protein
MYDTIVIGQDISSLLAAIISARRGLKTALVRDGEPLECFRLGKYTFNIDPFPWFGCGETQVLGRFLRELNPPPSVLSRIAPLNPALQIVHPRHRLDLFLEREELLQDLVREFPEKAKDIERLYQRTAKDNSFLDQHLAGFASSSLRSLQDSIKDRMARMEAIVTREPLFSSRYSRTLPKNSLSRNLLEAGFFVLSNLQMGERIPLVTARLLFLPLMGIYYFQGGKHLFLKFLHERFESLRGDLIEGGTLSDIQTGTKVEMRLRRDGQDTTMIGRQLLVSTKWPGLRSLVLQHRRFRRLKETFERPEGTLYPFTIHLGIDEKGIPERMSEYVAVIPDEQGFLHRRLVFLETSAAGDEGLAPPGRRSLSATVFLDRPAVEMEDNALETVSKTILASLRGFLPFLEENIDVMSLRDSMHLCRLRTPVLDQKYRFKKMPDLGIFNMTGRTPLKNVFITGGFVLPGLGFEGEVISGIQAGYFATGGLDA